MSFQIQTSDIQIFDAAGSKHLRVRLEISGITERSELALRDLLSKAILFDYDASALPNRHALVMLELAVPTSAEIDAFYQAEQEGQDGAAQNTEDPDGNDTTAVVTSGPSTDENGGGAAAELPGTEASAN